MSLITDPLYLIHISRIKFLRMDERGERIISFPPTVMSDHYVRLAAPVYPEMQYCYSPVYDGYFTESSTNNLSSPRTTKRNYRQQRKTSHLNQQFHPPPPNPALYRANKNKASEDSSDDEEEEEEDKVKEEAEEEGIEEPTISFHSTSLHPSVDSAIDPSPRSSLDQVNNNVTTTALTNSIETTVDISRSIENTKLLSIPEEDHIPQDTLSMPLEYNKSPPSRSKMTSNLSALIAEKATAAENPFSEYSFVSGKGESKSITLCVYLPTSNHPYKPVKLIVKPDAITDDVIGYILYDYVEAKRQPELDTFDLAEWVLLIAEDDGEIEDDLPAIDRTRNIGRVSFDQFALCRATPSQAKQNDIDRAKMGRSKPDMETLRKKKEAASSILNPVVNVDTGVSPTIEVLPEALASPQQQEDGIIAATFDQHVQQPDASTVAVPIPSSKATLTKATMPMTPLKYFRIKLMTSEEVSATTTIAVYAEMFIGDVLELVSRKRKLDPNEYMLMIANSKVIVPNDTTVESMKDITDLTLTKKTATLSVPTSSTTTHLWRSPIKRKKEEVTHPMYFSSSSTQGAATTTNDILQQYKKYTVSRKMPMFVSKRVYILAIDGDYIHLMPPEHKGMFDSVKTSSFHASAVRSCKQSKKVPVNFKIMILKERDFKTYDLEAESAKEASEICGRIKLLMQVTKGA